MSRRNWDRRPGCGGRMSPIVRPGRNQRSRLRRQRSFRDRYLRRVLRDSVANGTSKDAHAEGGHASNSFGFWSQRLAANW